MGKAMAIFQGRKSADSQGGTSSHLIINSAWVLENFQVFDPVSPRNGEWASAMSNGIDSPPCCQRLPGGREGKAGRGRICRSGPRPAGPAAGGSSAGEKKAGSRPRRSLWAIIWGSGASEPEEASPNARQSPVATLPPPLEGRAAVCPDAKLSLSCRKVPISCWEYPDYAQQGGIVVFLRLSMRWLLNFCSASGESCAVALPASSARASV